MSNVLRLGVMERPKPGPRAKSVKLIVKRWEAQLAPELLQRLNDFFAPIRLSTTTNAEMIAYLLDIAEGKTPSGQPRSANPTTEGGSCRATRAKRRRAETEEGQSQWSGFEIDRRVAASELRVVRGGPTEEESRPVIDKCIEEDEAEWVASPDVDVESNEPLRAFTMKVGRGQEVKYAAPLL